MPCLGRDLQVGRRWWELREPSIRKSPAYQIAIQNHAWRERPLPPDTRTVAATERFTWDVASPPGRGADTHAAQRPAADVLCCGQRHRTAEQSEGLLRDGGRLFTSARLTYTYTRRVY